PVGQGGRTDERGAGQPATDALPGAVDVVQGEQRVRRGHRDIVWWNRHVRLGVGGGGGTNLPHLRACGAAADGRLGRRSAGRGEGSDGPCSLRRRVRFWLALGRRL